MRVFAAIPSLLLLILPVLSGCRSSSSPRVVLYCSQDREYAQKLLEDFSQRTGIQVELRGDTEANKTVSLYEALVREADNPRCDVFWCNEPVLMQRLAQRGLLEDYESPSAANYPDWTRPTDRTWQAFAARARVLIIHERVPEAQIPRRMEQLLGPEWKNRFALAKPFFGTTATHMACLWTHLGPEKARSLYRQLAQQAVLLPGNRDVARAVAQGEVDAGWTDTDDALEMIAAGKPVRMIFPDQPIPGTLLLPNTLALIKQAPHAANGKKLMDYLLSAEVETTLANGPSKQLPLNPKVSLDQHPLRSLLALQRMPVKFADVASQWDAVQSSLRESFKP